MAVLITAFVEAKGIRAFTLQNAYGLSIENFNSADFTQKHNCNKPVNTLPATRNKPAPPC